MYDPQFLLLFKDGVLVLAITVHVDDMKIAGPKTEINSLVKNLEGHFGKLTYQENDFTNCRICHKRLQDGSRFLDQTEYLSARKPINPKHYANLKKDDQCTEHLRALYWSPVRSRCLFRPNTGICLSVYIFFAACQSNSNRCTCQKIECTDS